MNAVLPDIAISKVTPVPGQLEWVGMQNIDLPILIIETDYHQTVHAHADVQVNLPAANVKGIHMSRLYRLLNKLDVNEALSPAKMHNLALAMIESHKDCESTNARLRICFDLLARRDALITQDMAGWKSYPVTIDAALINGVFTLQARVTVKYSSTCPCSAALSRQLIEQGFAKEFAGYEQIDFADITAWLRENASLATPHSQRSEASVQIDIPVNAPTFSLIGLIDQIEEAVGTPVQTAVKRADEQAFAELNGQNLMFVEDAARRIEAILINQFANARVYVRHLESLHPHDAVAWASPK